jgi:hypothetical protein
MSVLSSGEITKNTNVLREDVLASTDDGNRALLELLVTPLSIRALVDTEYSSNSPRMLRIFRHSSR